MIKLELPALHSITDRNSPRCESEVIWLKNSSLCVLHIRLNLFCGFFANSTFFFIFIQYRTLLTVLGVKFLDSAQKKKLKSKSKFVCQSIKPTSYHLFSLWAVMSSMNTFYAFVGCLQNASPLFAQNIFVHSLTRQKTVIQQKLCRKLRRRCEPIGDWIQTKGKGECFVRTRRWMLHEANGKHTFQHRRSEVRAKWVNEPWCYLKHLTRPMFS